MFKRNPVSRLWHFLTDKPENFDGLGLPLISPSALLPLPAIDPVGRPEQDEPLPVQTADEIMRVTKMYLSGEIDRYRFSRYYTRLLDGETVNKVVAEAMTMALEKRSLAGPGFLIRVVADRDYQLSFTVERQK